MSDDSLSSLLPTIDIAAFERTADGSFTPAAPTPRWFRRLGDVTFPFLGHILEEANQFWGGRAPGFREWGPCAEVDEAGREFHYKVTAVTVPDKQFLLFQLDPASDRLRAALQKARDQNLAVGQEGRALGTLALEARRAADEIREGVVELQADAAKGRQADRLVTLSTRSADLVNDLDELVRALHLQL